MRGSSTGSGGRALREGSATQREVPLPCGSTRANGCACLRLKTYRSWRRSWSWSPWAGRLACGGASLVLVVGPVLGGRPALSLGRSGPAGSCWGEREVIWMKLVRGDVHLYEPPLLTVTLTPFCSLGSLRMRWFQKVFRSSNKLTKSHSKTLLPRNQVNLIFD